MGSCSTARVTRCRGMPGRIVHRVDSGLQRRMLGTMDADTSGTTAAMATPDTSTPPRQAITVVYTDGSCLGNPGPGGWAWAVPGGRFTSGAAAQSTNQRMEITAVLEAVRTLEGPLEVVSDSTYVINCFRDRWWEGWLRTGWITSGKQAVANRDLWEPLIEIVQLREIAFRWVKGHSRDPMNDLVDQLAVEAARTQRGRQGIAGTVRSPARQRL
jgi:ribonuclease HI